MQTLLVFFEVDLLILPLTQGILVRPVKNAFMGTAGLGHVMIISCLIKDMEGNNYLFNSLKKILSPFKYLISLFFKDFRS